MDGRLPWRAGEWSPLPGVWFIWMKWRVQFANPKLTTTTNIESHHQNMSASGIYSQQRRAGPDGQWRCGPKPPPRTRSTCTKQNAVIIYSCLCLSYPNRSDPDASLHAVLLKCHTNRRQQKSIFLYTFLWKHERLTFSHDSLNLFRWIW